MLVRGKITRISRSDIFIDDELVVVRRIMEHMTLTIHSFLKRIDRKSICLILKLHACEPCQIDRQVKCRCRDMRYTIVISVAGGFDEEHGVLSLLQISVVCRDYEQIIFSELI